MTRITHWHPGRRLAMRAALAGCAAAALTAAAVAQTPAASPAQADAPRNYYAAGHRVELTAPLAGDAVVAGRIVNLNYPVAGDILGAGQRVTLTAPAADDVRVAGADVTIASSVEGDLTAGGGDLTIAPPAVVKGRAWLTGGSIRTEGRFERDLWIYGGDVVVGGEVRESMHVVAQKLTILPSANLHGPVRYRGPVEAVVEPGATLAVPVAYERVSAASVRREQWPRGASSVLFAIHLTIVGLLLLLVLPRMPAGAAATLRERPGYSLLAGFVLLVTVPAAAVLFVVSIIGLPVGLALVALYLVALLLGVVTSAYYVGDFEARLLNRPTGPARGRQAFALIAGVLTLAVLRALPFVGGLVVFVAVVFGLGSLAVWGYRGLTGPSTQQPAHA